MWWGSVWIDRVKFPSFFVLVSMLVHKDTVILLFSYRSFSASFSLVDCSTSLIIFRGTIVVSIDFSLCFLMRFSVRPGQVFSKHCLIALRRVAVVRMKRVAWRYCASSDLVVWIRMQFTTATNCCVSRGTFHIPFWLFLVPFMICCPFFWTHIYFLSIVMVHPS